ncbi:hypothetical protein ACFL35_15275 [Candidatus Riflebacteria bacterium]
MKNLFLILFILFLIAGNADIFATEVFLAQVKTEKGIIGYQTAI